ncbi:LysE family translocator [Rhodobium gokarnense]|uniref:Threonine/homoserine/homoserine lactone efflux protein n=1 Tax=Rhodobium gokarnense TaxID=364296 RepID=A0ABT3HIW5_9HYPH|nr:LysE family translocator [Rhodobium gokarnense]MCW2310249.1 threonine/homoserine/homoserine lactone efflux protein [Rhodobium gokarnense]
MIDSFLSLATFLFVAVATPGPNNMMLLASGATFGFTRTVPHMLGIVVGFSVMVVLTGFGVGGFLKAAPTVSMVLTAASLLFLLYLAWRVAIASPPGTVDGATRPMTFLEAAAFQWINPKAWATIVAMVSLFAAPAGKDGSGTLAFLVVFLLVGAPAVTIWCIFGRAVARFFRTSDRAWRLFSIAMAVLLLASVVVPMLS